MEFNLAESLLLVWQWKEATAQLAGKAAGKDNGLTNPAQGNIEDLTDVGPYGILTISPSLEAVRLRPPHSRRRGRVIYGSGGAGTWNLQVILDTDDSEIARFFDTVENGRRRFGFAFQPFRRELLPDADDDADADIYATGKSTLAPAAGNPLYQGSLVLTSIDPWGPGGQDPAILSVTAELDSDYAVYRS